MHKAIDNELPQLLSDNIVIKRATGYSLRTPESWLGVLSPALSQTSRGQRAKTERLGTRLGILEFLTIYIYFSQGF